MKLSNVTKVWEELCAKDTGQLNYRDLQQAIEKVEGIKNDVSKNPPLYFPFVQFRNQIV